MDFICRIIIYFRLQNSGGKKVITPITIKPPMGFSKAGARGGLAGKLNQMRTPVKITNCNYL